MPTASGQILIYPWVIADPSTNWGFCRLCQGSVVSRSWWGAGKVAHGRVFLLVNFREQNYVWWWTRNGMRAQGMSKMGLLFSVRKGQGHDRVSKSVKNGNVDQSCLTHTQQLINDERGQKRWIFRRCWGSNILQEFRPTCAIVFRGHSIGLNQMLDCRNSDGDFPDSPHTFGRMKRFACFGCWSDIKWDFVKRSTPVLVIAHTLKSPACKPKRAGYESPHKPLTEREPLTTTQKFGRKKTYVGICTLIASLALIRHGRHDRFSGHPEIAYCRNAESIQKSRHLASRTEAKNYSFIPFVIS